MKCQSYDLCRALCEELRICGIPGAYTERAALRPALVSPGCFGESKGWKSRSDSGSGLSWQPGVESRGVPRKPPAVETGRPGSGWNLCLISEISPDNCRGARIFCCFFGWCHGARAEKRDFTARPGKATGSPASNVLLRWALGVTRKVFLPVLSRLLVCRPDLCRFCHDQGIAFLHAALPPLRSFSAAALCDASTLPA